MGRPFNAVERRVLGVLLEKSMTQPEYYPMTINAIVAGCNQKSNRDPFMQLDEGAVSKAIHDLKLLGLVSLATPAIGARSNRFEHEVETYFGWQKRQRAVMTELLIRGPQTVGELRTHCARMVPFESLEAVSITLDSLAQLDPPMVATLPRSPGQSAIRHTHLLYPDEEKPASQTYTMTPATTTAPSPAPVPMRPVVYAAPAAPTAPRVAEDIESRSSGATSRSAMPSPEVSNLQSQIEELQGELADLHTEMADLRRRLESIENQLL